MTRVAAASTVALLGVLGACDCDWGRPARPIREDAGVAAEPAPEVGATDPADVIAPPPAPSRERPRTIVPAPERDESHAGTAPVTARRIVYRVTVRVPSVLGVAPDTIPPPTTELFVDVSADRLHARFAGPGWPVPAGSEVRLRRDRGGAYVFDADGGRPIAPGQLSAWFQGGDVGRGAGSNARVRMPPPAETIGPGALVCAMLAEWAHQERDALMRRCGDGAAPAMFRIGPWTGERTADVPIELPASGLRADGEDPPAPIPGVSSRAFMEPAMLARIEPSRRRRPSTVVAEPGADAPGEGLRIRNESATRIVVAVGGVPIGWVDTGATGHFVGLVPGEHLVSAMRPLGTVAYRPRALTVPADLAVR